MKIIKLNVLRQIKTLSTLFYFLPSHCGKWLMHRQIPIYYLAKEFMYIHPFGHFSFSFSFGCV